MRPWKLAVWRPYPRHTWLVALPPSVRAHAWEVRFARGIVTIVGMLIGGDGLMVGRFIPEPWPTRPSVPKKKNAKIKAHVAQKAA